MDKASEFKKNGFRFNHNDAENINKVVEFTSKLDSDVITQYKINPDSLS